MRDRIMSEKEVIEASSYSSSTIRRLENLGRFPYRLKIPGTRRIGWLESDITEYLNQLKSLQGKMRLPRGQAAYISIVSKK